MSATVQHLIDILQEIAPPSLAESWDNVGLLVGSDREAVRGVLLGLDPLPALLAEAERLDANLVITHHPAIFRPLPAIRTDHPAGRFIRHAISAGINVIGCHTNLDAAPGGVSDVLALRLGLEDVRPLVARDDGLEECGLGRLGDLRPPLAAGAFLDRLRTALAPPWLLAAGPRPAQVRRVAVCGGSCSEFAENALRAGADVYITAEVKHATARWAEEAGLWIIDAGHFATENPAMAALQKRLQSALAERGMETEIHLARQEPPLRAV